MRCQEALAAEAKVAWITCSEEHPSDPGEVETISRKATTEL